MEFEILLVTGCVLLVLSIVAIVSAWADRRRPRVASIVVVIGAGMVLASAAVSDHGLGFDDIPRSIVKIVAAVTN